MESWDGREHKAAPTWRAYSTFACSFTDAIIGTIRYGYARRINDNLGTGGNNLDLPTLNPINNYNLMQFDLTFRF